MEFVGLWTVHGCTVHHGIVNFCVQKKEKKKGKSAVENAESKRLLCVFHGWWSYGCNTKTVRSDVGHENSTGTKELLKRCVKEKIATHFGRFCSSYCSHGSHGLKTWNVGNGWNAVSKCYLKHIALIAPHTHKKKKKKSHTRTLSVTEMPCQQHFSTLFERD